MLWTLIRTFGLWRLARLAFRLLFDKRVPGGVKLILPAVLAYLISPIDPIPDFLLGIGQVDDILVTLGALAAFLLMTPRDVLFDHIRGRKARGQGGDSVIEGKYRVE